MERPALYKSVHHAKSLARIVDDPTAFQGKRAETIGDFADLAGTPLSRGDSFIADFGNHFVGTVTLKIGLEGINDSPCALQLRFAEIAPELTYDIAAYKGWLNASWFYTETVRLDVLPCEITLPRRYAFRYLRMSIPDSEMSYRITVEDISVEATTGADYAALAPLPAEADPRLKAIDAVAVRTLSECMQEVYEDGPKRDRRLWIGDMRLQAMANYATFRDTSIVRYCLELFAHEQVDGGYVSPCYYQAPTPHPDQWHFLDYSLFFISCLHDYVAFSGDTAFLQKHWALAYQQATLTAGLFDADGNYTGPYDCFVDWCPGLNKEVSRLSILVFTFKQAQALAGMVQDAAAAVFLQKKIALYTEKLLGCYDSEKGCFVSGGQVSLCSQAWATLAGVLEEDKLARAMAVGETLSETLPNTTPYMKHIILEAYWTLGQQEKVLEITKAYWGKMVDYGADTFFELFDDDNHYFTTARDDTSYMLNSFCHAWSCTPCLFIRRYYGLA